jgi:hypothetical protein
MASIYRKKGKDIWYYSITYGEAKDIREPLKLPISNPQNL